MYDIVSLGELLIDFTPAGKSEMGNSLYECNPGGGVANFAVAAARLGSKVCFIGQVGQDQFGQYLKESLASYGVDISGLIMTDAYMTTLAFVHLFDDGDRDFTFYRKNGADAFISKDAVRYELIDNAKAMHFSALSMVNDICKEATLAAVEYARSKGVMVTYDPNWRPSLWEDADSCKVGMQLGLDYADVVKVSEEEARLLTDLRDEVAGAKAILARGARLVVLTLGDKGCYYVCQKGEGPIEPFRVKAVDATGAGDACFGATVSRLVSQGIDLGDIDIDKLESILRFANAAAALSVTRRGGMPAMPTPEQVCGFINEQIR